MSYGTTLSAETSGEVFAYLDKEEYNELLEKSGKSEEEFNQELAEKVSDVWESMAKDGSLFEYSSQSQMVEIYNIDVDVTKEKCNNKNADDDFEFLVTAKYNGEMFADAYIRTETRNAPDDAWSEIEKASDSREMADMVEKILDNALKEMGFEAFVAETDDYEQIDWEEELYNKEHEKSDYLEYD